MTEKTNIEISRKNWQWLNALKRPGESFNDVLNRLREGDEITAIDDDPDPQEQLPQNLDLPGSGETLERRKATIARLYAYLQDQGTASKSDFLELVDPDDVRYSTAESFWSNCVKGRDSLSSLPHVEPPGEGQHTWQWTS